MTPPSADARSPDPAAARIAPVRDADLEGIEALWRDCDLWRPWNDPARDIARCREAADSELLVARDGDAILGTVMCGHDGHRGWVYYLAVATEARRCGLGRRLMRRAERLLKERGAPKAMLMIRAENDVVRAFYEALGYQASSVRVMESWLDEAAGEARRAASPTLDMVVTYLEMTAPPRRPKVVPPPGTALMKLQTPSVAFYRFLYGTVGEPWLWYERRLLTDIELAGIVGDPQVEIYVLWQGGEPAGFAELDRRTKGEVTLAYFGLLPDFIGRGLGLYLLSCAVDAAWHAKEAGTVERVRVDTCNFDHPRALGLYQRYGFMPVRQERRTIDDPRAAGILPAHPRPETGGDTQENVG